EPDALGRRADARRGRRGGVARTARLLLRVPLAGGGGAGGGRRRRQRRSRPRGRRPQRLAPLEGAAARGPGRLRRPLRAPRALRARDAVELPRAGPSPLARAPVPCSHLREREEGGAVAE